MLWLLAFLVTAAETSVGAAYTRAVIRDNLRDAIGWGVLFEALLLADMWFLIADRTLAVPILIGAGVGIWWTMHKKRVTV